MSQILSIYLQEKIIKPEILTNTVKVRLKLNKTYISRTQLDNVNIKPKYDVKGF